MKKMILGLTLTVLIGLAAALGLLDARFRYDDMSEQEYQISIEKAVLLFKKESDQTKIQKIQFVPRENAKQLTNNSFEYQFIGPNQIVVINPTTGQTTSHKQRTKSKESELFDIEEISKVKTPQLAMKEAIKKRGEKNTKIRSWTLLAKGDQLYYKIKLEGKSGEYCLKISA